MTHLCQEQNMNKPKKCECGKMIQRPSFNKSGLCYGCSKLKIMEDRKFKRLNINHTI